MVFIYAHKFAALGVASFFLFHSIQPTDPIIYCIIFKVEKFIKIKIRISSSIRISSFNNKTKCLSLSTGRTSFVIEADLKKELTWIYV